MARRRRSLIVPEAAQGMNQFQAEVMKNAGFSVDRENPQQVKYEVAKQLGVALKPGYNGKLSTEEAGKVGGKIGGTMVKEMIRMAQEQLSRQRSPGK